MAATNIARRTPAIWPSVCPVSHRSGARRGRVAACARRPQDSGFLRRPRGRGIGIRHPRWLAALERQARQMAFQTNALPMVIRERAAAKLTKFAGLGFDTVFWLNSGAEANENALKLAFKLTGRSKAVALEQSFHGRTAAAGAVTWGALEKWYGFPRTRSTWLHAARRRGRAGTQYRQRHRRGHRRTRAGRGRRLRYRQADAAGIAQRCDDVGAMLIFDEVQCGVGRTGVPSPRISMA
jgi:4-aminobutyrate aminotransferase-like enzyme